MPLGSLVTVLDVDLRRVEQKLKDAKRLHQDYVREVQKLSVTALGAGTARGGDGGAGRGIAASPEVQARLNDLRQMRVFREELKRQDALDARDRAADARRRAQEQDRLDRDRIQKQRERLALLNQVSREQAARERQVEKATRDAMREVFGPGGGRNDTRRVLSGAVQDAARLRKEAAPLPDIFSTAAKTISGQLNKALDTSFRIANELKLLVRFGVLGGVVGLVAEGFKLNKEFEQFRITMGATVALTHDVVDATGRIVEGPQKLNFILGQTPKFFQEIRKLAAETLLEQNELVQTISENIGLAAQAGFKINTAQQRQQTFGVLANIAQLAKAIGLPGGQRQLTQEVRALMQGERLQGATIAKILGFTSGTEIARLQGQPSREGNANRFIDELTTRLKAAQPFLDQFKNSFSGLATTLISQSKEFLRLSFTPVFQRIVEVMKRLRDQFGDDVIQRGAQRIGETMATIVDEIAQIGQLPGVPILFRLFEMLAANADKLIMLFLAMKGLGAIGALTGGRGAGAVLKGGLGSLAGMLGAEGAASLAGPAGLLLAAPFVPGLAGSLGRLAGRGEPLLPGKKAFADEDPRRIILAQIQAEQSRLSHTRGALREVRERGRGAFAPGLAGPELTARPEALERSEAASVARIAERRKSLHDLNLQMIAKEQEEKRNEIVKERLEARKAMAEAKQDREGQLKAQLALDRFNIEQTVKDVQAAKKQQAAATERFNREMGQLREDEYLKTREQLAALTNDEIGQIKIRTEKEIIELKRRHVANSDFVRLRQAILAKGAQDEQAQRLDQRDKQLAVQEATAKRFGQSVRAQAIAAAQAGDALIKQRIRGEITEKEFVQGIKSINFEYQEGLRKQREETHNKGVDLLRKFADESKRQIDIQKNFKREEAELEERLAKRRKDLLRERADAERGLTDAIRNEHQARQNLEFGGATREIRRRFEEFALLREAPTTVTGPGGEQFTRETPAIRDLLFQRQLEQTQRERPELAHELQIDIATQRVRDTLRELADTLVGPDGLAKVLEQLKGAGVEVTDAQKRRLAGLSIAAGTTRQEQVRVEDQRAAEAEQRTVMDARREVDAARDRLEETKREQAKFPAEADRERTELNDKFKQEVRDNTIELFRLGQEIKNFRQEVGRAGIAIDQQLLAAINRLSPLTDLGPAATQKAIGAAAALSVSGTAPFIGPPIPSDLQAGIQQQVKGFRQEFFNTGSAFAQPMADIVNSPAAGGGSAVPTGPASITTNNFYSLDGVQLGSDTRAMLEELGKKLQRDARRTP